MRWTFFLSNFSTEPGDYTLSANLNVIVSSGQQFILAAGEAVVIKCGQSEFSMTEGGSIRLKGVDIEIEGEKSIKLKSARIDIN